MVTRTVSAICLFLLACNVDGDAKRSDSSMPTPPTDALLSSIGEDQMAVWAAESGIATELERAKIIVSGAVSNSTEVTVSFIAMQTVIIFICAFTGVVCARF